MDSLPTSSWLARQLVGFGGNQFSLAQIVSLLPFLCFVTPGTFSKLALVLGEMLDWAGMIRSLIRMLRDIVIRL